MTDKVKAEVVKHGTAVEPQEAEIEKFLKQAQPSEQVDDAEAVQRAIIERILSAEDTESILGTQELTSSDEMIDVPFQLTDVRWNQSGLKGGLGFYAIMEGKSLASGDTVAISCSGQSLMAQVYALKQRGKLPLDVAIRRVKKPTARGFYPLYLDRADAIEAEATPAEVTTGQEAAEGEIDPF